MQRYYIICLTYNQIITNVLCDLFEVYTYRSMSVIELNHLIIFQAAQYEEPWSRHGVRLWRASSSLTMKGIASFSQELMIPCFVMLPQAVMRGALQAALLMLNLSLQSACKVVVQVIVQYSIIDFSINGQCTENRLLSQWILTP